VALRERGSARDGSGDFRAALSSWKHTLKRLMKLKNMKRLIAAGALICSANLTPNVHAASFLTSDVTRWIGPDAGVGISQAVMVIQWPGQINGFAWGYRWQSTETKTGADMLAALVAASNGYFTVSGLDFGFITDLQWQGNSFPVYNAGTGQYLQYFVNNAQQSGNYNDGAAPGGAHVLPPLGSPYDEAGPGEWVASNTGVLGRPLVDGSWDGWAYRAFGDSGPGQAVNAPAPIPEPSSVLLVAGASLVLFRRRRVG